ncbi:MAG: hypothetical protein ABI361_11100 [Nitrososphaera sp.]
MAYRILSEEQKRYLGEQLALAVLDKEAPNPADLERAALIFYDVSRFGYILVDDVVREMLAKSGRRYSDAMLILLADMANAISSLASALNNQGILRKRMAKEDLESLSLSA